MTGPMVHLGGVHLPIALSVITLVLFVFAIATKSPGRLKFAVEMMVIGAALSWPAFLSGEKAEHFVEDFVGLDGVELEDSDPGFEDAVHEHEEFAEKAHYGYQALGVIGIIGWFFVRKGEKFRMPFCIVGLVLTLALAGAMGYTGYLGGHVRHLEVRKAAEASSGRAGTSGGEHEAREIEDEHEDEDDDH